MRSLHWVCILAVACSLSILPGCGGRHVRTDESPSSRPAQPSSPPEVTAEFPADATRVAHWREDLHYLATELPKRHKNFFYQLSKKEFRTAVEGVDQSIPAMTDGEIKLTFARLVAMAGDAHTNIGFPYGDVRRFPLGFRLFADGVFVTRAADGYSRTLRARLVKVGETHVDDATRTVTQFISHENDAWVRVNCPRFLNTAEALRLADIIAATESARFVFQDTDGKRFEEVISSAPYSEFKQIDWVSAFEKVDTPPPGTDRSLGNYWFRYLEDSRTLYLQYNVCGEMPGKPFADFTNEVFAFIDSHPVDRFILDLRYNGGGNSKIIDPLVRRIQESKRMNTRGRLFVLIGPGTFSSGVHGAVQMRKETEAILVGEPTGGKPNSYGELGSFRLPNSEIRVPYSTKYFRLSKDDTPSLNPDIAVPLSSHEYFSRRDPVLEAVLDLNPDTVEEPVRQHDPQGSHRFVADDRAPTGIWTCVLKGDEERIRLVLHVSKDQDGRVTGRIELPDLGIEDLSVDRGYIKGDNVYIELDNLDFFFSGKMSGDRSAINGRWKTSSGERFPLTLVAVSEEDLATLIRQERRWQPIVTDDGPLEGDWSGILKQGSKTTRFLFRFQGDAEGELLGFLDGLDQGITGVRFTRVTLENGRLALEIESTGLAFEGDASEDLSIIRGELSQGEQSVSVTLNRQ